MTKDQLITAFQEISDTLNRAILTNNAKEIKNHVSNDWVLVGAESGIIPQERFFQALEQGVLTHETMSMEVMRVKVYGEVALVTGRGQNTGTWQDEPMEADEWITDAYIKENGRWLCALTHLTPVAGSH